MPATLSAAEEAYVYGNAILWDHACVRGCAVISGPSRIGGNAIIEDYAIITAGYVHGNVHISGNAKLFANSVTGGIPVVMEGATVYGELGGEIEVRETAVILPGVHHRQSHQRRDPHRARRYRHRAQIQA